MASPPPPPLPLLDDGGSGSVMAEMLALFAPPGRDSKRGGAGLNPRPVELHPYYRRPGKGHNHDCCDACGEGGDLICCDHCPASFHFSCHAPPLEDDDIPMGDWMCLRCYVREQGRLGVIKASGQGGGVASSDEGAKEDKEAGNNGKGTSKRSSRSSQGSTASGASSGKKQPEAEKGKADKDKVVKLYKIKYDRYLVLKPITNSPFDKLIGATQVVNAEQFTLPSELEPHESLPFDWKWAEERQDDFDAYPKLCFACSKTSRNIPSVGCDFCPNVYHLDCLNPPLCEIPKERWMCPAHPEHLIDSKVVKSTSFTERIKLWNKYAREPVDTDSVRLEFFRKARMGRLFQKCGRRTVNTGRKIQVPQFIKDQYRIPLPRLPTAAAASYSDPPPARPATVGEAVDGDDEQSNAAQAKTEEDEDDFLAGVISMQESILREKGHALARQMYNQRGNRKRKRNESGDLKNIDPAKKVPKKIKKRSNSRSSSRSTPTSDITTDSDCSVNLEEDSDEESPALTPQLREALNLYLSRKLRLQFSSQKLGEADSQAETKRDADFFPLKKISPVVRDFLAMQRIKELFPEEHEFDHGNEVRARAVFLPLQTGSESSGRRRLRPFFMRYRTADVGVGSSNQVDLSLYGHCNFASARHATVYFDQLSQVYELINYSEHGTIVDNAVYALSCRPASSLRGGGTNRAGAPSYTMNASGGRTARRPCHCETSVARMLTPGAGCENSAVLHHGSLIRIGCLQFVFSVVTSVPDDGKTLKGGGTGAAAAKEAAVKAEEIKQEASPQEETPNEPVMEKKYTNMEEDAHVAKPQPAAKILKPDAPSAVPTPALALPSGGEGKCEVNCSA